MNHAARAALTALVRGEVRTELAPELERLDWLAAELDELRHRLALVEQRVGLAVPRPRGAVRRRHAVIELRRQGHSLRAIEVLLGVARGTIEKDLRAARVSLPPDAVGVDGKPIGRRAGNGHGGHDKARRVQG